MIYDYVVANDEIIKLVKERDRLREKLAASEMIIEDLQNITMRRLSDKLEIALNALAKLRGENHV